MQEIIQFNSNQVARFENENIGSILLDFKTLQADGIAVANISDLNKIAVEIAVYRVGQRDAKYIVNGYLDDILTLLSAGSTRYVVSTTKRTQGYLINIPFDGNIELNSGDYIEVKVKAQTTAFTSLSVPNSDITIETTPATVNNPQIAICELVSYTSGEININKALGNNIARVVLLNDLSNNYGTSTKSKPVNGITLTGMGFDKVSSENALLNENVLALQNNPETPVKALMVYNSSKLLHGAKFVAKYDKAVDADAKIMVIRKELV
tara:strand:+ start:1777 stop:2574 length:798 start_codon:yes stop_codon:yes gene_type:complete